MGSSFRQMSDRTRDDVNECWSHRGGVQSACARVSVWALILAAGCSGHVSEQHESAPTPEGSPELSDEQWVPAQVTPNDAPPVLGNPTGDAPLPVGDNTDIDDGDGTGEAHEVEPSEPSERERENESLDASAGSEEVVVDAAGDTHLVTEPAPEEVDTNGESSDLTTDEAASGAVADRHAPPCSQYAAGVEVGALFDGVTEVSGLVESRRQPGVMWLHEDSGTGANLFAMNPEGELLGRWAISAGARLYDWEDIAIGPGADGVDYIWAGDIGDNAARAVDAGRSARDFIRIIQLAEPSIDLGATPIEAALEAEATLQFTYPDHPHDAEALTVDPRNGDLYIFAKENEAPATVFRARAPLTSGELEAVAVLDMSSITAADFSASGQELLVRNYFQATTWQRGDQQSWRDVLRGAPNTIRLQREGQGEAIAYASDGSGFYTVSEGEGVPIWYYAKTCNE